MTRTIIVTDLTRFNNRDIVCLAGIDPESGECIRPMPYLGSKECERLGIQPGAKLRGEFSPATRNGPHQEDYHYADLRFDGPCTSRDFRAALEKGRYTGVEAGFEIELQGKKYIPAGHPVARSIVTVRVDPTAAKIVEDGYKPGKIKLNFTDDAGTEFRYIGITDLGFHDFAQDHRERQDLDRLNEMMAKQEDVFLRIGLSRVFKAQDGREGYWLQANGIYTFPEFNRELRRYA